MSMKDGKRGWGVQYLVHWGGYLNEIHKTVEEYNMSPVYVPCCAEVGQG